MKPRRDPVFRGSLVALPTPFRGPAPAAPATRGAPVPVAPPRLEPLGPYDASPIDFPAFRRLIERQIEGGSDGVVVAGTTGEAATLSLPERAALFEYAVGVARRRTRVLAGIGSSDTRVACELARVAARAGADGVLVSTPSYNRPTQEGLRRHYAEIASSSPLPLCLYNVPSRTGVDLLPATVARIADEHETVVAIKEAATSLDRVRELVQLKKVAVLAGEDGWIADAMQIGAAGVVGVVANLVPKPVSRLVHAFDPGRDPKEAPGLVESLAPLVAALFLETNPAPLKAALARLGLCEEELRLLLVPVADATRARLEKTLAAAGLLG